MTKLKATSYFLHHPSYFFHLTSYILHHPSDIRHLTSYLLLLPSYFFHLTSFRTSPVPFNVTFGSRFKVQGSRFKVQGSTTSLLYSPSSGGRKPLRLSLLHYGKRGPSKVRLLLRLTARSKGLSAVQSSKFKVQRSKAGQGPSKCWGV